MSKRLDFKEWLNESGININDMIEEDSTALEILEEVYNKEAEIINKFKKENEELKEFKRKNIKMNLCMAEAKKRLDKKIKNLEEENSNLRDIIRDTKDLDAGALYDLRYSISLLEEDSFEGWTNEEKKGYLTAITTIKKEIEKLY